MPLFTRKQGIHLSITISPQLKLTIYISILSNELRCTLLNTVLTYFKDKLYNIYINRF